SGFSSFNLNNGAATVNTNGDSYLIAPILVTGTGSSVNFNNQLTAKNASSNADSFTLATKGNITGSNASGTANINFSGVNSGGSVNLLSITGSISSWNGNIAITTGGNNGGNVTIATPLGSISNNYSFSDHFVNASATNTSGPTTGGNIEL